MPYSLSSTGKSKFPRSYSYILTIALNFIEKEIEKTRVESILRERQVGTMISIIES